MGFHGPGTKPLPQPVDGGLEMNGEEPFVGALSV